MENLYKGTIGKATGSPFEIGARLCTRDGRRIGNAVTIGIIDILKFNRYEMLAIVLTDAGMTLEMTAEDLNDLFFAPDSLVEVQTIGRHFEGRSS